MKLRRILSKLIVALSAFGILLPPHATLRAADSGSLPVAPRVSDIELEEGGVLRGLVVDVNGQPRSQAIVTLKHNDRVTQTKTDPEGRFTVNGLQSGVYVVSCDSAMRVTRAWSPRTAPPSAHHGILLAPPELTIRGQHDFGPPIQWGIAGLVVGGIVASILIVTLDDDDAS